METTFALQTLIFDDLMLHYDILKRIVKGEIPNCIAVFINENMDTEPPALAEIVIIVRKTSSFDNYANDDHCVLPSKLRRKIHNVDERYSVCAHITHNGDVMTFCEKTRYMLESWIKNVKTREKRYNVREGLFQEELCMKTCVAFIDE